MPGYLTETEIRASLISPTGNHLVRASFHHVALRMHGRPSRMPTEDPFTREPVVEEAEVGQEREDIGYRAGGEMGRKHVVPK